MSQLDDLPWQDIGHGVSACEFRYEAASQLHIAYLHKCSIEGLESGAGRDWKLEHREPLTISPSLLCMTCNHHGFIRDGKWIPA
jgi:hypothetical protein